MSRRALICLSLLAVAAAAAFPVVSPWRIRAGRTRHAREMVALLESGAMIERDRAERSLAVLGTAALPALEEVPGDAPAEVHHRARRVADSIRRTSGLLGDPDRRALHEALIAGRHPPEDALLRLGPDATPRLVAAVRSAPDDPRILDRAVRHAARHGGPGAESFLLRALTGPDVPTATIARAAEGLATRSTEVAVETARHLLRDDLAARRSAAVRVLLARGTDEDRRSVAAVVADPSPLVRRACTPLLADPRTRSLALALLRDAATAVRLDAIRALDGARDPAALRAIRQGLGDRSARVRIAAVEGLAAAHLDAEVAALTAHPSLGVRLAAQRLRRTP